MRPRCRRPVGSSTTKSWRCATSDELGAATRGAAWRGAVGGRAAGTIGCLVVPLPVAHPAQPAMAGPWWASLFTAQTWVPALAVPAARGCGQSCAEPSWQSASSYSFYSAGMLLAPLVELCGGAPLRAHPVIPSAQRRVGAPCLWLQWTCAVVIFRQLKPVRRVARRWLAPAAAGVCIRSDCAS